MAVNAFFLLSGFVLAYGYLGYDGTVREGASGFFRARIGRIYPAYLLGFTLALTTILLWPDAQSGVPYAAAWSHHKALIAVTVLTLLQGWKPIWDEVINPPAWSLSVEALFYITFPFVAPRLIRLRWAPILIIGSWVAALALSRFGLPRPLLHCPEFYAGVLLGRAYATRPIRLAWWVGPPLLAAIPATLFAASWLPLPLVEAGLLDPLIVLLLLILATKQSGLLCGPAWRTLGESSYALYITHWPLWAVWAHLFGQGAYSAGGFALYAALVTALAVLIYWIVERPARRWIQACAPRPYRLAIVRTNAR